MAVFCLQKTAWQAKSMGSNKMPSIQVTILRHLPWRASMHSIAQRPVAMLLLDDRASGGEANSWDAGKTKKKHGGK